MDDGHGGKSMIKKTEKEMPPSRIPSLLTV